MRSISRRDFLQDSALAAALAGAGVVSDTFAAERSAAAKKAQVNDQLRVAVIGVHGRGMSHVGGFAGNTSTTASSPPSATATQAVIGGAMKAVEKAQGKAPKFEQDIRKVVEDKNIDIVSIATPNHWHALAAIWAMQNGKDVYVEKPVSHNVSEGRRIVEAARKYQPHLPGRHAEPQPARACARRSSSCTPASSARSGWPAACATSSAPQHRQGRRAAADPEDGRLRSVVRSRRRSSR